MTGRAEHLINRYSGEELITSRIDKQVLAESGLKQCFTCKLIKPADENFLFDSHNNMYRSKCAACRGVENKKIKEIDLQEDGDNFVWIHNEKEINLVEFFKDIAVEHEVISTDFVKIKTKDGNEFYSENVYGDEEDAVEEASKRLNITPTQYLINTALTVLSIRNVNDLENNFMKTEYFKGQLVCILFVPILKKYNIIETSPYIDAWVVRAEELKSSYIFSNKEFPRKSMLKEYKPAKIVSDSIEIVYDASYYKIRLDLANEKIALLEQKVKNYDEMVKLVQEDSGWRHLLGEYYGRLKALEKVVYGKE